MAMRVLDVLHYPVFGGPHNQALRLARPLEELGWQTTVVLPQGAASGKRRLSAAGVAVEQVSLHRVRATLNPVPHARLALSWRREVEALERVIASSRSDVVQVSGLVNPHAAVAARRRGVPVVWQILDTRSPWYVAAPAIRMIDSLADVVMATGPTVMQLHPGWRRLADRVVYYLPPVDTREFRPRAASQPAARSRLGVPADAMVVGCVANLNPQKGLETLIDAFADARRELPAAHLIIVGSEHSTHRGHADRLRDQVRRRGMDPVTDVIFAGMRDDVHLLLPAFDVFAFTPPKHSEGISTTVLEAMSCGLPVVATDVAGLHEVVTEGVTGYLRRPDEVADIANAIVSLLRHPQTARRFGARARERAVLDFSSEACAQTHAAAYEAAMER